MYASTFSVTAMLSPPPGSGSVGRAYSLGLNTFCRQNLGPNRRSIEHNAGIIKKNNIKKFSNTSVNINMTHFNFQVILVRINLLQRFSCYFQGLVEPSARLQTDQKVT